MINIFFTPQPIIPSSCIEDITVQSDSEYIDVLIYADNTALLSERYYLNVGIVSISNLRELVEQYLAGNWQKNLVTCNLDIKTPRGEKENVAFKVIYCDRIPNVSNLSEWLHQNFLTLAPFRRVALSDNIPLSWFATTGEELGVIVDVTYLDTDGSRAVISFPFSNETLKAPSDDTYNIIISPALILNRIKETLDSASILIQLITVRCGERCISLFLDPSLDSGKRFYFLNCFNVLECLNIHCTIKEKISSDRSIASLGRISQFYDVSNSMEYETETGPLTLDYGILLQQMLSSSLVKVTCNHSQAIEDFDSFYKILITDYTCELSDSNQELNKVKFTWRFADNIPLMNLHSSSGIFSEPYNPFFS